MRLVCGRLLKLSLGWVSVFIEEHPEAADATKKKTAKRQKKTRKNKKKQRPLILLTWTFNLNGCYLVRFPNPLAFLRFWAFWGNRLWAILVKNASPQIRNVISTNTVSKNEEIRLGDMPPERWRNWRKGVRGPQWPCEIFQIVSKWQNLKLVHDWIQFRWAF